MIACVIPARFDSSRFPGKLLAIAKGKTILQRTFERAKDCFDSEQIFIATDNRAIYDHAQQIGAQAIWTSSTCKNGTERIAEAVRNHPRLQQAEIVVNLQGDHPTTDPHTIQAAVELLQRDTSSCMSTAAAPICCERDFRSPHIVKVIIDKDCNALYFSRSPIPFCANGLPQNALQHIGLYCFRRKFLLEFMDLAATPLQLLEDLEQLKALENGYRIQVALVNEPALGVDVPEDLAKLEALLCQ